MWKIKKLSEMTPWEIYQVYKLRIATFVVEQNRIYQEIDEHDLEAFHIFAKDNNQISAYARVYLIDHDRKVTFGRVVTAKNVRGQGLGDQLLDQILNSIKVNFSGKSIEIESQSQVKNFYKQKGFVTKGNEFIFESTPHIKMIHSPV
ncbi:MAG: GNAT family N-acetyltransferase [Lactobacillaceae bacterium]